MQKVFNQYSNILQDYKDNTEKIVSIFRTKILSDELREGDLVYFKPDGKQTISAIIPVSISRKTDNLPLGKRFHLGYEALRPCTYECLDDCDKRPDRCDELKEFFNPHPKGLCPACRLFGTTSYKGRVSFGFARLPRDDKKERWYKAEEADEGKPLTLPLLERPRPTWSMPDKASKIPGRKFYVHHPHSVDQIQGESPTSNNRTIEPLDTGNEFTFDVHFMNLEEYELGLLLYSLQLEKGLAHKLGMGKALGFGSVEIGIEKVEVRNSPGKWKDKTSNEITGWVDEGKKKLRKWFKNDWDKVKHIADLRTILYFAGPQEISPKVRYPCLSMGDDKKDNLPGYVELKRKPSEEKPNPYYMYEDRRKDILTTPWKPWFPAQKTSVGFANFTM